MKLKDWAAKQGITYLTAYRWFHAGTLPVKAYQSDSGTIIVQDESDNLDPHTVSKMGQNDAISLFFKKTMEFSKNEASVEDFAAWIFSTFSLKLLIQPSEGPKYSRQKPKAEEVQKHFQKFIPKGEKPKPHMLVGNPEELDNLVARANGLEVQELVNKIRENDEGVPAISHADLEATANADMTDLLRDLSVAISSTENIGNNSVTFFSEGDGAVLKSALSPQSLNYTSSNCAFSSEGDIKFTGDTLLSSIGTSSINLNSNSNAPGIYLNNSKVSSLVDKPKRGRPKTRK